MSDNPRWEYCKVRGEDELKELGEAGWEAYAVDFGFYYLKRRCA